MVIEVEMKFAVPDEVEILQHLVKWKVEFGQSERQVDLYFFHPIRDFADTDEALRIRRTESRVDVAYKGPRLDTTTKTRQEIEVSVSLRFLRKDAFVFSFGFQTDLLWMIFPIRYFRQ